MTGARSSRGKSGLQYEIVHAGHRAVIAEVGATLREYSTAGRGVVAGFALDEICHDARGQVLAPWPNRLGDGRYEFEGVPAHAALDEPSASNAIHGLVRWLGWSPLSQTPDSVTMGCVLHPQPGYPWQLSLVVGYRLGDTGLSVSASATNESESPVPFGIGFHPYIAVGSPTAGTPTVDEARIRIGAGRYLLTDGRSLPVGSAAVSGTPWDFREGRRIGATALDTAFGDLDRDDRGVAQVDLDDVDGTRVSVWMDQAFRYAMVYTADHVGPPRARQSVAIEPMSCPPDALRTGDDLVRLEPGSSWTGRWGIRPDAAARPAD